MKKDKLPIIFYVVSLELGTSGCDDMCFNAKEVKNSLAKYIKTKVDGRIVIKQFRIRNRHIIEDFTKNEFMSSYFDGFFDHNDISYIKEMSLNI